MTLVRSLVGVFLILAVLLTPLQAVGAINGSPTLTTHHYDNAPTATTGRPTSRPGALQNSATVVGSRVSDSVRGSPPAARGVPALTTGERIGIIRTARTEKGNFGVGSATRSGWPTT